MATVFKKNKNGKLAKIFQKEYNINILIRKECEL